MNSALRRRSFVAVLSSISPTRTLLLFALMLFATRAQAALVTETFASAASATANGWVGVGNTINGNTFGFSNTGNVTGSAGEAGGTFARSINLAYYADTNLGGTLLRSGALHLDGSVRLVNQDFDGSVWVGFFNTSDLTPPTQFIGISFAEPLGGGGNPFRALASILSSDGTSTSSSVINIPQSTTVTFNLNWNGINNLSGTINGTAVNLTQPGVHPNDGFNAFGIGVGFANTSDSSLNTGLSYFDSLTYTDAVVPEPSSGLALLLGAMALLGCRRRRFPC